MAEDQVNIQRLVVSLEANMKKYDNAMAKSLQQTTAITSTMDRMLKQTGGNFENTMAKFSKPIKMNLPTQELGNFERKLLGLHIKELNFEGLKSGLTGLLAAFGVAEIAKFSDEWTNAKNRIASAGIEAAKIPLVMENIAGIAERSRNSIESTATVYASMTRAAQEFGASQTAVATVTETVTKALATSGATTQEIKGALVDLTQGMQRGVLQGQELRALLGEVPAIAQAIAKEFGVSVGQVKQLGEEGKLTAERVFNAIEKSAPAIDAVFASTKPTIEQAMTLLENSAAKYVGTSGVFGAATAGTTTAIQTLAKNFDTVANGASALGLVIATRLVSSGLTPMLANFGAAARAAIATAPALNMVNVAIGAAAAQAQAGALAVRGLSAVLGLIGGPVGAIILGTTAAIGYMAVQSERAKESASQYAKTLDQIKHAADSAAYGVKGLGEAIESTGQKSNAEAINNYRKAIEQADATTKGLENSLRNIESGLGSWSASFRFGADAAKEGGAIVQRALEGDSNAALEAKAQIAALANLNPNFQGLADSLMPILTQLEAVRAAAAKMRAELATIGTSGPQHPAADSGDRMAARNKAATDSALANRMLSSEGDEGYKADQRAKEITKDIKEKTGATLDYSQALRQANREIAAETPVSKGRKGPKSDADKHAEAIKREILSLQEEERTTQAETAAIGLSNSAKRTAIELAKLKISATSKEGQEIGGLISKIEQEKQAQERLKASAEGLAELKGYTSNSIQTALDDIILKGGNAKDVLNSLAQSFQKAMLDGVLFGNGPLGKLLGGGGEGGGIFGQILGGGQGGKGEQNGGGGIMGLFAGLLGQGGGAQTKPNQTNNISVTNNIEGAAQYVAGGLSGLLSSLFGGGTSGGAGGVSAGPFSGMLTSLFNLFHDGGIVGAGGGAMRAASPAIFSGAPKFHSGLLSNETPAILQHGEEVLTKVQQQKRNNLISGLANNAGSFNSSAIMDKSHAMLQSAYSSSARIAAGVAAGIAGNTGNGGGDLHVVVNNSAGANISTKESQGIGGQRQLQIMVENMVADSVAGNGTVARTFQNRYGLNRSGGR